MLAALESGASGHLTRALDRIDMAQRDELELCQSFLERGAAEVVCARLVSDGVPAHIEAGAFDAPTRGFNVMVPRALAHRARWILAQLPPSEEELEYLATGELRGKDSSA